MTPIKNAFDELEQEFLMRKRARRKELFVIVGCGALLVAIVVIVAVVLWTRLF